MSAPDYFMEATEGMGGYPHSGQGLPSGFAVRDLVQMLRAQKARSGNGSPPTVGLRGNPGAKAGNASGLNGVRRMS